MRALLARRSLARCLLLSLGVLAPACVSKEQADLATTGGAQAARVRNSPPPGCTVQAAQRCEAIEQQSCPAGHEPVIDYDRTCCPHFSCQPLCPDGARAATCDYGPAPSCPAGSELVIGSDDQCCPFYRCRPTSGAGGARCSGTAEACAKTLPYCGGTLPVEVGLDQSCCPIYQCPCASGGAFGSGNAPSSVPEAGPMTTGTRDGTDTATEDPAAPPAADTCGCTYPTCAMDEVRVCLGTGPCNAPCVCQAIGTPASDCTASENCEPGSHCELAPSTDCPPCPVGVTCPPCTPGITHGKCVRDGGVANGCSGNADCGGTGFGFECQISCQECMEGTPGCVCSQSGSAPNPMDPNAPPTTSTVRCEVCAGACIAVPSCGRMTDPTGGSTGAPPSGGSGGGSTGGVPPLPDGNCPRPECANPMPVGFDEMTCCPIYTCAGSCTQTASPCPVPMCANPVFTGVMTDSCCPSFCCPGDAGCPSATPVPCKTDFECPMTDRCALPPGCATTNTMAGADSACVGICLPR